MKGPMWWPKMAAPMDAIKSKAITTYAIRRMRTSETDTRSRPSEFRCLACCLRSGRGVVPAAERPERDGDCQERGRDDWHQPRVLGSYRAAKQPHARIK